jgi:hypothetical protein
MMSKEKHEKLLEQLEKERFKDMVSLERDKERMANQLKGLKKEDILPAKPEKLSLWKRIKIVLGL